MNYFAPKDTAERYAKGRPYFHRNTIEKVKEFLKLEEKFKIALDVACGTGLSTKALLDIAEKIYGTDTSEEMLKQAEQNNRIIYSISAAEKMEFADKKFDLISVCSGVHWFDIDKFLNESQRILINNGWLVIYDNFFISEMENVPEFNDWFFEIYLKRFPSPNRKDNYNWNDENINKFNFNFVFEDNFKNTVEFTKNDLITYFTTQSNISNYIEKEKGNYTEIENWLNKELTPFFSSEKRNINYGNWIKYLQKRT